MLKRHCLVLLFAGFASSSWATDYSDMWYLPTESGWGVNFTQNQNVIFMTFFLYGPDGEPTWYSAAAIEDANGNFSGTLVSTTGTYFGSAWGGYKATLAGTASFTPTNPYQGTLSYTLVNGPTVTKSIVRQTLTTITLAGNFTGGYAGTYAGSTCGSAGNYKDNFDLDVSQANGNVSLTFSYIGLGESCTLSGALVQNGQLYTVPSANYTCDDGLNTSASLSEIKKTSLGIEGKFSAPNVGGGCSENASFSAVGF